MWALLDPKFSSVREVWVRAELWGHSKLKLELLPLPISWSKFTFCEGIRGCRAAN
jgi:hypothetical protein